MLVVQVVLRKGGIREPAFAPVARRFLLFPTSFHSGADLVEPGAAARFAKVPHLCTATSKCPPSQV